MTSKEFLQQIEKKNIPPLILVYGEEEYLADECLQAIIRDGIEESAKSFNFDMLSGNKADAKAVIAIASSYPMMSERRLLIVKEFDKLVGSESAKEIVSTYIQNPLASTCFVAVTQSPDFRKKPFTDFKKHAQLVECKPLYDNQVIEWIQEKIRKGGKSTDFEACRLLHAFVGNSLRMLESEIEKLFIYVSSEKAITAEHVAAVAGTSRGFTIFELQNAIGKKDLKEALRILKAMTEAGQSPQMIIVMLTRFINLLWKLAELKRKKISDGEISKEVGLPPFIVKQILQYQTNFSNEHLESAYRTLLEADTTMKSSSRDTALVMDFVVYSLIRGHVPAHSFVG